MDQITSHPWFTRRPPRPQPSYLAPPTPDQMTRPAGTRGELDPDILSNLRTLWFGASEESIIRALISEEKCWEKVFYFLLTKYRQRHLENFNADDGSMGSSQVSPKRRRPLREHVAKTAASAVKSRSRTSLVAQNRNSMGANPHRSSVVARGTNHEVTESPRRPLASRQVTSPPNISTPQRPPRVVVAGRGDHDVFAYPKQGTPTSHGVRPLPPAPTQSSPIATRKPPPRPPAITLQEATPSPVTQTDRREGSSYPYPTDGPPSPSPAVSVASHGSAHVSNKPSGAREMSPALSVVPPSPASTSPRGSDSSVPPSTPIIQIPQTVDADMQRFFRDIVDQLQNMSSMRTPTLMGTPNTSAAHTPLMTPPIQDFSGSGQSSPQFEDAEETSENEEAKSDPTEDERRRSSTGDFVFVADSVHIPSVATAPPLKPRPKSLRISSGSGGSKRQTAGVSTVFGPGVASPAYMSRHGKAATMSLASTRSGESDQSATMMRANKENENADFSLQSQALSRRPTHHAGTAMKFGLGIQTSLDDSTSHGAGAGIGDEADPSLRRRKGSKKVKLVTPVASTSPSLSPTPSTGNSTSAHSPTSPKVSWFANLFAWKSVNYQLMSVEGVHVTRHEAKRLLEACGVFVVVEHIDSSMSPSAVSHLKCRFDDRINGSLRPVRFRVEFTAQTSAASSFSSPTTLTTTTFSTTAHGSVAQPTSFVSGSPNGSTPTTMMIPGNEVRRVYACAMTLTLEKGSASTFKSVCNALRKSWELDIPKTASVGLGVRLIPSPMPSSEAASARSSTLA